MSKLYSSRLSMAALALAGCTGLQQQAGDRAAQPVDRTVIPSQLPPVANEAAYRQMLRSAREWQRKAQSVDGEWRDVEPLLLRAERAAAIGDLNRAIDLAEMARFQSEMGYRQMRAQEQVDNPPYLYY